MQAIEILNKFDNDLQDILRQNPTLIAPETESTKILLYNDNFLLHDWTEASILFANSTCFSQDLMVKLSEKAQGLKKGAIFITFTKKLPELGDNWIIKPGFRRIMSWGIATIFVHRKIN